jgi:hypothetical protein
MTEDRCMMSQAKLHHRTFLKSPNEFVSCYEALEKILFGFTLYQWQEQWVISYRGEMFNSFGPQVGYYNYDKDGEFEDAGEDFLGAINIGKDEAIHPVNANQMVSWQPGNVSVKTNYKYEVPENLVNNEKLQELGDLQLLTSGPDYRTFEIVGWTQYHKNIALQEPISNLAPSIRVVQNPYGFEIDRHYRIPHDSASTAGHLRNYIMHDNTDLYVEPGDVMSVNVSWRTNRQVESNMYFMQIALYAFSAPLGTFTYLYLNHDGRWSNDPTLPGGAIIQTGYLDNGSEKRKTTDWMQGGISDFVIPQRGQLFIALGAKYPSQAPGDYVDYKGIDIVYNAFKEGDKRNTVKGDYWRTDQAQNIKDALEEETAISDSIRRIFKGALWQEDGTSLTNPTWYRKGDPTKTHHYKSLINWTKYQLYYRRFKRITGTFRGTLALSDNFETPYRLPFHKHFRFSNDFVNRMYLLTGPCTIDYLENRLDATFVEVEGPNRGGNPNGDSRTFNYIF